MSNPIFNFETAKREQCKASILIEGLSGRGKSGLALILGFALAKGDKSKVFDIDTENKSIQLFSGIDCSSGGTFDDFKIGNFTPDIGYKPSNYILFREAAIRSGALVVINDSISHAWTYKGGLLDMVAALKKSNVRYQKDNYAAWGDDEIIKEKQELFQLFRDHRTHIISTVRVKEKMEYGLDDKGKTTLTSLGEQEIMQADVKYEPDLVLHMLKAGKAHNNVIVYPRAKVVKSRYAILTEGEEYEFTPALCEQIREYLEEGTSPAELLEQQRQSYVGGVKDYLDSHTNSAPIWNVMKTDAGFKDVKLIDMPLDVLKNLFIKLTID